MIVPDGVSLTNSGGVTGEIPVTNGNLAVERLMSPTSTDRIVLTDQQRNELTRRVHAGRTELRLARRTAIVLLAAEGQPNTQIAASLGMCEDTVRKWLRRWCAAPGLASLGDAKRCGRRPVFSPVQVAQVKC